VARELHRSLTRINTACGPRGRLHVVDEFVLTVVKALAMGLLAALAVHAAEPRPDAQAFMREVDLRLDVPAGEQTDYAKRLEEALAQAALDDARPQYFVLVDRSALVQAAFVYWRSPQGAWQFIGASPVSTGRPGGFEHFLTPRGVFAHSILNMDFRAEGTRNALGILGYGRKGMRVYDFGWIGAERTWGAGGIGVMRLQMHATDPELLEPHLGAWRSKGCIRIPASLNVFIDRYGLLDADYEAAVRAGERLRVLRPDREPTPWPGRWLVVIDSQRGARPPWSPRPAARGAAPFRQPRRSSRQAAALCLPWRASSATTSSSSTCGNFR
jgi:hypothetical protein